MMLQAPPLNYRLALGYSSASQRIRIMTELWLSEFGFCPSCSEKMQPHSANKPVADFTCTHCQHDYELKSKAGALGRSIVDGAYSTMMQRLHSDSCPSLFVLSYSKNSLTINNLIAIPSHFFRPEIIQRRKPLAEHARRAGWVGCNILLGMIPVSARIPIVANGFLAQPSLVKKQWQRASRFASVPMRSRGWLHDVLSCVENLPVDFNLADVYQFSAHLKNLHPYNANIEAKIRQQLQLLRDLGIVAFLGRGRYRHLAANHTIKSRTRPD